MFSILIIIFSFKFINYFINYINYKKNNNFLTLAVSPSATCALGLHNTHPKRPRLGIPSVRWLLLGARPIHCPGLTHKRQVFAAPGVVPPAWRFGLAGYNLTHAPPNNTIYNESTHSAQFPRYSAEQFNPQ
jgi:hypothetical protein